jgi:hypothetical protein
VENELSPDLAWSLASAYLDRKSIHTDLCRATDGCGVPTLLTELVELLIPGFVEYAERHGLEDKPFWAPDHPEALAGRMKAGTAP